MGMKKKLAANILAAAVALLLVAAGVLTVGWMQGWFDKKESGAAVLTEIRSVVRMEHGGVAYPVEEDTVLRAGDKIDCTSGVSAVVRAGGSTLTLGENAAATITEPLAEGFEVQAVSGEIFVDTTDTAALELCGEVLAASDAVAWVRAESGAESIAVFAGQVGEAEAEQILSWQDGKQTIGAILSDAFSDFAIVQLSRVDSACKLCFTAEELEQLQRDQQPAVQENADTEPETAASKAENPAESSVTAAASESSENDAASEKPEGTESSSAVSTAKPTAIPKPTATPEPVSSSCTVSIRCDTILNNWDKLDSAKAGYVPSDGWILYTTVSFEEGETVFDVLQRACSNYGISLEYSWFPMYGDYYIEGINNIYEFDCGSQSGWMYTVNGWFPSYGCSSYVLSNGDSVEWRYTCSNGEDIGG